MPGIFHQFRLFWLILERLFQETVNLFLELSPFRSCHRIKSDWHQNHSKCRSLNAQQSGKSIIFAFYHPTEKARQISLSKMTNHNTFALESVPQVSFSYFFGRLKFKNLFFIIRYYLFCLFLNIYIYDNYYHHFFLLLLFHLNLSLCKIEKLLHPAIP